MARRHYLVSYDISEDRTRTDVFQMLEGLGNRVQYSVFFCDLNRTELAQLHKNLEETINHTDDQVIILDLGKHAPSPESMLKVIGKAYQPPVRITIV